MSDKRATATPGPWRVDRYGSTVSICAGKVMIAQMIQPEFYPDREANAAHIVRAVNSHAQLVAALQTIADETDQLEVVHYIHNIAVAALKLAEGEL